MNIYIAIFATGLLAVLPGCGKKNNKTKETHKKESHSKKSKKAKNDMVLEALDLGNMNDMDTFSAQTFDDQDHDAQLLNWDKDDQSMRRTPDGQFKPIYFDFDKYDVRADQQQVVDEDTAQAQKVMKKHKHNHKKLVVEGHASPEKGSRAYNMALSQKRAEKVKTEHVKRGLSAENITTVGRGQEMPVTQSPSIEGNALNRRVEEFAIDN